MRTSQVSLPHWWALIERDTSNSAVIWWLTSFLLFVSLFPSHNCLLEFFYVHSLISPFWFSNVVLLRFISDLALLKDLHVAVEKMNGKTLLQATQASENAAAQCCALFQEPKKLDSLTKSSTGGSFALCSVFRCAVSRCAFLSAQVSDLTVTKDALINILREARQAIRCDSLFVSAHLRHSHINTVHFNPNKNNCTPFIPLLRFPLSAQ